MSEIPDFSEAVQGFKVFLRNQGYPATLVWVFRDDLWKVSVSRVLLRRLDGDRHVELSRKVFGEGRSKGLVEIGAIAQMSGATVATVWYPKYEHEEVQGWSKGLKLTISRPLPVAILLSPLLWTAVSVLPGFRAYQRNAFGIGTKRWATAT